MVFASDAQRVGVDLNKNEFGPRFGMAYYINPKTVVRGGYGISYAQTLTTQALGQVWNGFSGTARANPPDLNPYGASFIMKDGFPQNTIPPLPSKDPSLLNGSNAYEMQGSWGKSPYVGSYNINVQRELPWNMMLDVAWAGAKGTRLISRNQWADALRPEYLALGSLLTFPVRSPEAVAAGIKLPYDSFQGTVAQALRPFPQYNDVSSWWQNTGSSTYNALQAKLTKALLERLGLHGSLYLV